MDNQSDVKFKCDYILNTIIPELNLFIAPILILLSVNHHHVSDIIANGTGTLLKLNDKYLLVTCHHVWEFFTEKRKEMPDAIIVVLAGLCSVFNLSSIEPISQNIDKDLVVFDISRFVKNEQFGEKKFISPEIWLYNRPEVGDLVIFLGYPGQLRQPDKSRINSAWYFDYIRKILDNSIILRDDNHECVEEYYDETLPRFTDLGGFSGCPVFVCRKNDLSKLELIGIVYEGRNEMFGQKVRNLCITYADFINNDGIVE